MKILIVLLSALIFSSCFPSNNMYWELYQQPQSHMQDAQFLANRILDRFDFLSVYSPWGSPESEVHMLGGNDEFTVSVMVERGRVTITDFFFAGAKGRESGLQSRRTPDEFNQFIKALQSLMQENGATVVIPKPKHEWGLYL